VIRSISVRSICDKKHILSEVLTIKSIIMFLKISLKVHKIQRRKKFIHGIQQINTIPCEKQYFMKCSEVLDDYQNAPLQKQLPKD
jgi:hypothetical protein